MVKPWTSHIFRMSFLNSLFKHRSVMEAVVQNLYISGWYTILRAGVLEQDQITHILSVMTGLVDSDTLKPYNRMIIPVNDDIANVNTDPERDPFVGSIQVCPAHRLLELDCRVKRINDTCELKERAVTN